MNQRSLLYQRKKDVMEPQVTDQSIRMDFPVCEAPVDHPRFRLAGLYPQVQEGLWMQRIRILGGRLTAQQWRAIADLVRCFTPGVPLHLTTRQDLEFHDLRADEVPLLQQALAAAGLTGWGACGDTLRNITVCGCSGVVSGSVDLHPLAAVLQEQLQGYEGIYSLPRKFKISLSCCAQAQAQPWINDLGFTVSQRDSGWGFRVTAGGSLGARPGTAILWREWLEPSEVPACARAAVQVFERYGNRKQRHRARLRHVREEMGDERFLEILEEAFREAKSGRKEVPVDYPLTHQGRDYRSVLTFPDGDLTPAEAEAIADLLDQGHAVRIENHHHILVFSDDPETAVWLGMHPILQKRAEAQVSVVACPGRRRCRHGLTDTTGLADLLRENLQEVLPPGCLVAISGCPNGCVQSRVADIGLVGQLTSQAGGPRQAYTLWMGGGGGRTAQLARHIQSKLDENEVAGFLREQGRTLLRL